MEHVIPSCALPDPKNVSLQALRIGSKSLISALLNSLKVIPNENGLPRDWRGLAHLIGFKSEKIPIIACDNDPTAKILKLWQSQQEPPYTVQQLIDFLGELDRFDIIDDTKHLIDCDMLCYSSEPEKSTSAISTISDYDREIITRDDVNGVIQNYDAFVVFADEDIDFATELIDIMEKQYGFKLCVKERDLVAGLPFEHEAIIQLISERCHRLIVIISPAYLKSPVNKFIVNYAHALGIVQDVRKVIPCLYEECDVPPEFRPMFLLNYTRSGKLFNFWEKLRDSIHTTKCPSPRFNNSSPMIKEAIANTSEKLPDLKPALINSTNKNSVKPKKNGVKFGSCSNLAIEEASETKRSASMNALNGECASSNTDSINHHSGEVKKKKKGNFLKRIMYFLKKEKKVDCTETKATNKIFKHKKTKVPVS